MNSSEFLVAVIEHRDIFQELLSRCLIKAGVLEENIHFLHNHGNVQVDSHSHFAEPDTFHQLKLLEIRATKTNMVLIVFHGQEWWEWTHEDTFSGGSFRDHDLFLVTYEPSVTALRLVSFSHMRIPELCFQDDIQSCLEKAVAWSNNQLQPSSRISTWDTLTSQEDLPFIRKVSFGQTTLFSPSPIQELGVADLDVNIVLLEESMIFQEIYVPRLSAVAAVHVVEEPADAIDQLIRLQEKDGMLILMVGQSYADPRISAKSLLYMLDAALQCGSLKARPFSVSLTPFVAVVAARVDCFDLTMPAYLSESDLSTCLHHAHFWNA